LNMVSFLVALTMYVRYKQIEQYYRDHLSPESSKILSRNLVSLWLGWIASFGLSIVANFQETNVFRVHMVGAMTAFTFGTLYSWLQTIMSFRMVGVVNGLRVARIRFGLSMVMTCSYMTSMVCGPMAFKQFHGQDPTNWKWDDGGYQLHLTSTVAEWISCLSLDFFIITFVREMHSITLSSPRVTFLIESLSGPDNVYNDNDQIEILRGAHGRPTHSSRRSLHVQDEILAVSTGRQFSASASQVVIH